MARIVNFEGRKITVPDDATDDEVAGILSSGTAQAAQPQASPSAFQRAQASVTGRALQGMRDPIDEAATMLPKGLQAITSLGGNFENPVSNFFGSEAQRVQDMNRKNEAEYQQSRGAAGSEGVDVARIGGNIASPANIAIASKIPMAMRGVQAIKGGLAAGAVGGALSPEGDVSSEDYWKEKGIGTAKGAGTGALMSGLLAGAARVIRPETRKPAQDLIDAGVTPTAGQILGGMAQKVEDKLQSVPILGDMIAYGRNKTIEQFNKVALNKALSPIGESVDDVGRAGMSQVKDKLTAAYDDLLPKLKFVPDAQFAQEMGTLNQMAAGLGKSEQTKFSTTMADLLSKASPNGHMQGETFKIVESKLAKEAKNFSGSQDAYQKELGNAFAEALRIFRDTLPRTNPQYATRLKDINTGYANFARLRQAASSTAAGANDGVFTPAQLAMAVKALDKSAGKGASATGKALMQDLAEAGTNVLSSKVADSGTAGRLGWAGAGAAGLYNPAIPIGLGVAGLPYVGVGKELMAAALTKRPQSAAQLAELVRKSTPYLASGLPLALNNGN